MSNRIERANAEIQRCLIEIIQYQSVGDTGIFDMFFLVQYFQIVEKVVDKGQKLLVCFPFGVSAGLDAGGYPVLFAFFCKFAEKITLACGFSAGKCHAAAGSLIIWKVFHNDCHNIVNRFALSGHGQSLTVAGLSTGAAGDAAGAVDFYTVFSKGQCAGGTFGDTLSAADTSVRPVHELVNAFLRLGISAPSAC